MDKPTHILIVVTCVVVIAVGVLIAGPRINANCVDLPFFHSCSVGTTK